MEIQENAASLPLPVISAHPILHRWHFVHNARGGTNRVPHRWHFDPMSFPLPRNCLKP